jgi:calcium-dependent protein kinase
VIADFGLAEFVGAESYLFVRCGTPGYVAPEVINIKDMKTKYSSVCDMFSLGLIFHNLLLGRSAFPGTTYDQVLSMNRAANIDLSGDKYLELAPEALDLLGKLLKKKPEERITASEALNHPYFQGMQTERQSVGPEQPIFNSSALSLNSPRQSSEAYESPLLSTANRKRKLDTAMKKDSCVEFHMGK